MFTNISETASSEINGSHLQGHVNISYNELVEVFGQPCDGDGYKVQKEWVIQFDDGTIATIYDWKWSEEYNGDGHGTHYTQVPEWNIGGFEHNAVIMINRAIQSLGAIEGEVITKQLEVLP
jgi:hypothetical protein